MDILRISDFKNKILNGNERTKSVIVNIGISVCSKIASVLASLLIIPLTINYVNSTRYGLWLTISTVIGWVHFFDLGLGNGLRNKLAESLAQKKMELAREYVSTTYFSISFIVIIVFIIAYSLNMSINWSSVLNVSPEYDAELRLVFIIVCAFTCANMVFNLFNTILTASQKVGYASIISAGGQYLILLSIFLLTKTTEGSLYKLAIFYAGMPTIFVAIVSIFMFLTKYKYLAPSIKFFRFNLIRDVLKLGLQFFIIYICLIFIFQVVNLIITREIGPEAVTQYNISNRYFNIVYMVITIVMSPIWSAFTEAYTNKQYNWMSSIENKLYKLCFVGLIVLIIMVFISPYIYKIWIGDSVEIPVKLSIAMAVLIATQSFGNIYMHMVNGTGYIRIQLITYVVFAVVSWPLFTFCARNFGLIGVIAIPSLVYLIQGILGKIQILKIISETAVGIWKK